MVNIYGPGLTGDQATSSRNPGLATGSGVDLWFRDCSTEEAQDGTRIRAQWLNFMLAQFREAIRGLGVQENELDDQMLLKCFQKLQIPIQTNWLNLPFFPESQQPSNLLTVSNLGGGSIRVDAGQIFIHRGWNKVQTNDYLDPARTVTHTSNKTYHLRWLYNLGSPLFLLKDIADLVYNPAVLPETNKAFDSTYDDMLIAKVVTDGSNVPTITLLKNKHILYDAIIFSASAQANPGGQHAYRDFTSTYNWARTPSVEGHKRCLDSAKSDGQDDFCDDWDSWQHPIGPEPPGSHSAGSRNTWNAGQHVLTRYSIAQRVLIDNMYAVTMSMELRGI